mmetsp:Transcript_1689/g.2020  ORF Transcript_1689/g.2020 Transcript_1689/m.2020 type:complete len:82 (+) Transcript_1689:148-393(+)
MLILYPNPRASAVSFPVKVGPNWFHAFVFVSKSNISLDHVVDYHFSCRKKWLCDYRLHSLRVVDRREDMDEVYPFQAGSIH